MVTWLWLHTALVRSHQSTSLVDCSAARDANNPSGISPLGRNGVPATMACFVTRVALFVPVHFRLKECSYFPDTSSTRFQCESIYVFLSFRRCPKHPNTPPFDFGIIRGADGGGTFLVSRHTSVTGPTLTLFGNPLRGYRGGRSIRNKNDEGGGYQSRRLDRPPPGPRLASQPP